MAQPSVVVVFTSRCGTTETLAHAAAIGTVNARTLPRLRRLADDVAASDACAETLRRLQREYVAPTEADIVSSEGLVLVPSAGMTPVSPAWAPFFALLDRLSDSGALAGKAAAVVTVNDAQTMTTFLAALSSVGAELISSEGRDARRHGRAVGEAVLGAGTRAS
jgi:hypothetical protein